MKDRKGFALVEGLLIVLVVTIIGFGMYIVWNSKNNDNVNETSQPEIQGKTDDTPDSFTKDSQAKFNIELPVGWKVDENSTAPAGTPESYYQYSTDTGKSIGISINSGGFGGGGDGSASYVIEGNKFILDDEYNACNPAIDEIGACRYGDSKLELIVSSTIKYKGDEYMFWLWDNNSEEQNAYSGLKNIVESIELN
jgi:hypothetical protein